MGYTTPLSGATRYPGWPSRPAGPIEPSVVPGDPSETTEYGVKNFAPTVNNRIQKVAWVCTCFALF